LLYQWQEGAEDLETYYANGYHPTHLGDRYHDGRYEVVHKLGFGSYSTIWLARDHLHNSFVALKIIVARGFQESTESRVLRALASGNRDRPARPNVISLLDEFVIAGPNGRHRCIISEAMGCSAANSKDETMPWKFPLAGARSIAAQVLLGLDYIHSCNVVHGGKPQPDN
jgi:serine/threonine protein kinase